MPPACPAPACVRPIAQLPYQSPSSPHSLQGNAEDGTSACQLCLCRSDGWRDEGHMAHLARTPGLRLAIQMQVRTRQCQNLLPGRLAHRVAVTVIPDIAKNIKHDRWRMLTHISQRQTRHRAHLLFELTGDAGIDSVMPAVMRAWCHFIDHQTTIGEDKELDTQHADVIKFGNDRQRRILRLPGNTL